MNKSLSEGKKGIREMTEFYFKRLIRNGIPHTDRAYADANAPILYTNPQPSTHLLLHYSRPAYRHKRREKICGTSL